MKTQLREYLEIPDYESIAGLAAQRKRALGVLVSITFDPDPLIAWRAVEAMGLAADRIAGKNPEFVRSHLRRLHWLLSEESGGICRHAPQAMAEIIRRRPELYAEYIPITVALLEDMAEEDLSSGFRQAVLWAIGRLAPIAPDQVLPVLDTVESCLDNHDPQVRGLAVWCLVRAGSQERLAGHEHLQSDDGTVQIYTDGAFVGTTIKDLLKS
jgi:hypothetical protein